MVAALLFVDATTPSGVVSVTSDVVVGETGAVRESRRGAGGGGAPDTTRQERVGRSSTRTTTSMRSRGCTAGESKTANFSRNRDSRLGRVALLLLLLLLLLVVVAAAVALVVVVVVEFEVVEVDALVDAGTPAKTRPRRLTNELPPPLRSNNAIQRHTCTHAQHADYNVNGSLDESETILTANRATHLGALFALLAVVGEPGNGRISSSVLSGSSDRKVVDATTTVALELDVIVVAVVAVVVIVVVAAAFVDDNAGATCVSSH